MSLLSDASLIITPNAVKASKLYSVVPNTDLGDMNVVRATTATRVNSSGLIENVGLNVPRLDYTNASCPSILVEPQRTNRLLNSETLSTQSISTTGLQCAVSFYGTGTIMFSGTFTGSLVGTGVNNRVTIVFTPTTGTLLLTVVGSVTKAQLETGSNATSYIPTVATTVTRNADVISKGGISSLIGQTQGTIYCEGLQLNRGMVFRISDGSNTNRLFIFIASSNGQCEYSLVKNNIIFNISQSISPNNVNYKKIILSYSQTNFKVFINGVLFFNIDYGNLNFSNTLNTISFGNITESATGTFKNIYLFKTQLTDQQAIQLTTL